MKQSTETALQKNSLMAVSKVIESMEPFYREHTLCEGCHDGWAYWEVNEKFLCDECATREEKYNLRGE